MEEKLQAVIRLYYADKLVLDECKKTTDEYNKKIKELMAEMNINEFVTSEGIKAKKTIQNRESFIEPKVIEKLKELGVTSPIKTVEVIDYDELENVIYNKQLDASVLSDYKEVKPVVTLKVTKK